MLTGAARRRLLSGLVLAVTACSSSSSTAPQNQTEDTPNMYARWTQGPPTDASYFPIAVWLQSPHNAARYKAAGINLYVGLWQGPTEEQLAALAAADMQVICHQNEVGLAHIDDPTIVGWMHGDEPDNAQWNAGTNSYDPPILPQVIVDDYTRIQAQDPSRPVLLNLGQGVAWDGWVGRGTRTNHPEDYPAYARGADIVSFDIYPVAADRAETQGKLWLVPFGVERLVAWTEPWQPVWNCLECTRINSDVHKATPHQVRAQAWMALIHGSRGLIYFVHEWKPRFNEHALLDDPEMLAAVTILNQQIHSLAPVLNSPTVAGGVEVTSRDTAIPVAAMVKRYGGATYVFAAAMRDGATEATFALAEPGAARRVHVIDEERELALTDGRFSDTFAPYAVHLYRIE